MDKDDEGSLLVMYNGKLECNGDVAEYTGSDRKLVVVPLNIKYEDLMDVIRSECCYPHSMFDVKLTAKLPLNNDWTYAPLTNDRSVYGLMRLFKRMSVVGVYVEAEPKVPDPTLTTNTHSPEYGTVRSTGWDCGIDLNISLNPTTEVPAYQQMPFFQSHNFQTGTEWPENACDIPSSSANPYPGLSQIEPTHYSHDEFAGRAGPSTSYPYLGLGLSAVDPIHFSRPEGREEMHNVEDDDTEELGDYNTPFAVEDEPEGVSANEVVPETQDVIYAMGQSINREDDDVVDDAVANNDMVPTLNELPDIFEDDNWIDNSVIEHSFFDAANNLERSDWHTEDGRSFWDKRIFPTKDDLVHALQSWHIKKFVQYSVVVSSTKRYTVHCFRRDEDNCKWRLHASVPKGCRYFQVKTYDAEHTCSNPILLNDNKQCSANFVCDLIMPSVRTKFTITPAEIMERVKTKYSLEIGYAKA